MTAAPIWDKGLPLDAAVHRFTVGDDPETDAHLLAYDALGSAAHARMLGHMGYLAAGDTAALVRELGRLAEEARHGELSVDPAVEDGHSTLELALTQRLGEAGKRIHLARSRNDQVALALRLFARERLLALGAGLTDLAHAFVAWGRRYAEAPMPGYSHMRPAMPSTFGMWAAAFAEALLEEIEALSGLYRRLNRCPLGAAAGYGVPLAIDRRYTARLLGFADVQASPIDVQNARGRHELAVTGWLRSVGLSLEPYLWDVALFSGAEFGLLELPVALTTGSSIMPQKRNPDVIEMARGRCRELRGLDATVAELGGGLPSGYHRDLQLLKRPLIEALRLGADLVDVLCRVVPAVRPREAQARAACGDELYAAQEAYRLVASDGLSFRDAYREVARRIDAGEHRPACNAPTSGHIGGPGQLGLEATDAVIREWRAWIDGRRAALSAAADAVWNVATCQEEESHV